MQPRQASTVEGRRGPPSGLAGIPWVLELAGVVVIVAGLKAAGPLLLPLMLAVLLAVLTAPLVAWMKARRIPSWLAVTLVVLVVMAVLTALGAVVAASVGEFTAAMPRYKARLWEGARALSAWVSSHNIEIEPQRLYGAVDPVQLINALGTALNRLAEAVTNTALVLLTLTFMLLEVSALPTKLRRVLARAPTDAGPDRLHVVAVKIQHYLVTKTVISAVTGLFLGAWVGLWGVGPALLWGLIAFIMNYIPNVGSILAAIPPIMVALVDHGIGTAAAVAVGFLAANMALGNLIEPRVMGRRLDLSPLAVFLSLLFWGWVWGPLGMLLSVPLTVILKIALEQTRRYAWVSELLSSVPEARPEPESRADAAPV